MLFGNKFKNLASVAGKEKLTAEEIASLNIELEDNGVTAVSFVDRAEEATANVAELTAQLEAAQKELTTAQEQVTAITTERDALKAELDRAAESRTSVKKEKDSNASNKGEWKNDPTAEYNQNANRALGKTE